MGFNLILIIIIYNMLAYALFIFDFIFIIFFEFWVMVEQDFFINQVFVLLFGKFRIIFEFKFHFGDLESIWFFFRAMKLAQIGVFKSLFNSNSFICIKVKHLFEQINSIIRGGRENFGKVFGCFFPKFKNKLFAFGLCDLAQLLVLGCSNQVKYLDKLICGRIPLDQRFFCQHFSKN